MKPLVCSQSRLPCLHFTLVVLAITAALELTASADVRFSLTDLGTLYGQWSQAEDINNSGQIVGRSYSSTYYDGFLYSGGVMTALPAFGTSTYCNGINNNGQVVGSTQTAGGYQHAYLYSSGTMTDLGNGSASGINNNGQVVGSGPGSHAFLYSGGSMTDLGTLGGVHSYGLDINDNGQVVGAADPLGSSYYHAFLYSGGGMTDLGTFGGTYSSATAINNSGQIAGWAYNSAGQSHAFLYVNGSMVDLGTAPNATTSSAADINDLGQIVGTGQHSSGYRHAWLFDGAMLDLNDLIAPGSGWVLEDARAINDSGQIVGYGYTGSGYEHAFLLTPVPEPSLLALLTLGSVAALLRGQRGKAPA